MPYPSSHIRSIPCPVPPMQPGERAVYGLKPRRDPKTGSGYDAVQDFAIGDRQVAYVRAVIADYRYVLVFGWRTGAVGTDRRIEPEGYLVVRPVAPADRERIRASLRDGLGVEGPINFW